MDFYRLNYSKAIFGPESGVKDTQERKALAKKVGVPGGKEKPLLVQVLESLISSTVAPPANFALSSVAVPAKTAAPLPDINYLKGHSLLKDLDVRSESLS